MTSRGLPGPPHESVEAPEGALEDAHPAKLGAGVRHAGWYHQPRMSGYKPTELRASGPHIGSVASKAFTGRATESTVARLIVPQWSSDAIIRSRLDR